MHSTRTSFDLNERPHQDIYVSFKQGSKKNKVLAEIETAVMNACKDCSCFSQELRTRALPILQETAIQYSTLAAISDDPKRQVTLKCKTSVEDKYCDLKQELHE